MEFLSVYDACTGKTTLIPVEPVEIRTGRTVQLNLGPEWTW